MILETAKKVILSEMNALRALLEAVDNNLEKAARLIQTAKGRVVVTGVGKSGHIGRKVAATLASTGTPAFFIHATEALHGDLGMITADDIVMAISYSGCTQETLSLVRPIRHIGAKLIAITGHTHSLLTQCADVTLDIGVREEADPLGLAPTNSTVAMLALGDALAIALSVARNFTREDFGNFHPGGSLGQQLVSGSAAGWRGYSDALAPMLSTGGNPKAIKPGSRGYLSAAEDPPSFGIDGTEHKDSTPFDHPINHAVWRYLTSDC